MSCTHRWRSAVILSTAAMLVASTATNALAQETISESTACRVEVESNDSLAEAVTLAAERCVSGTLVEVGDVDLFVWQVDAEAAETWTFSLSGEPARTSSARVVRIEADAETGAPRLGAEVGRIALGADGSTAAATADIGLDAGEYAIVLEGSPSEAADARGEGVAYELRWSPSDASSPGATLDQARIVVIAPDESPPTLAGDVAVELLLDTSGSMLTRLGRATKLKAAERSLISLVDELPAGLPVALRTFKTGSPSCETVLRVPAGPLRAKAMARTIRELPARKGTRTPIAKALSKAPQDLDGLDGHRVVVLVTDGKENCGGDPAAAIRALADAGYTSAVHIIGYTVGGDTRDALAGWAALGGGRYLDAPDRAGLDAALATAFTAPYLVFDDEGRLAAQGLVGDEGVELDVGTYRVEVLTDPAVSTNVELEAGAVVDVSLTTGDANAR